MEPFVADPGEGEHDEGSGDHAESDIVMESFHFDESFGGQFFVEQGVDEVVVLPSVERNIGG